MTGLPSRFHGLGAVIFDLDGVITRTASVHFAAWKALFDPLLAARGQAPFDEGDYARHVDGKPRQDGVRDFLASRGIAVPEGAPDDPPEADTLHGLGRRKNGLFRRMLAEQGVEVFDSSVLLVEELRRHGIRTAVVSSSKNARAILANAGLLDLFDLILDGADAQRMGLAGKPAPDTFLQAAERLGLPPEACAVVEDAVVGVQAGAAGEFRLVVGIDRGAGHDALAAGGADVVVDDLKELDDER